MLKTGLSKKIFKPSAMMTLLTASSLLAGCQVEGMPASAVQEEGLKASDLTSSFQRPSVSHSCDREDRDDDDHSHPVPLPSQPPVSSGSCYTETFQQPTQQVSGSVDILFVADTSGSMSDNRRKVADGISRLVNELPGGVDYRIGMMLAHGSVSPSSGLLWRLPNRRSQSNIPYVLDSNLLSENAMRGRFRAMMSAASDYREQGEMGLYSFMQSIRGEKLAENQARGFFRANAALAVVFISDENDICAVYPQSAGGMPGLTSTEAQIRARDCADGISAASVLEAARGLKGNKPVTFGAIIHSEFASNERHSHSHHRGHHGSSHSSRGANDGYGWGYEALVTSSDGVIIDIDECDYDEGLEAIGRLVRSRLDLITSRTLEHSPVDQATIRILVDGAASTGVFVPATNVITLDNPGSAGSTVEINYCLQQDGGSTGGGSTGGTDPIGGGSSGGTDPIGGGSSGGTDPIGGGSSGGTDPIGGGSSGGTDPIGGGSSGGTDPIGGGSSGGTDPIGGGSSGGTDPIGGGVGI